MYSELANLVFTKAVFELRTGGAIHELMGIGEKSSSLLFPGGTESQMFLRV